MVLEVVGIAVIAITLSLFSGNLLSSSISDKMLNDQIAAQESQLYQDSFLGLSDMNFRGYGNDISTEDLRESYQVSLNGTIVILYYLIGIATVFISTLLPVIYITKLNPKKILM